LAGRNWQYLQAGGLFAVSFIVLIAVTLSLASPLCIDDYAQAVSCIMVNPASCCAGGLSFVLLSKLHRLQLRAPAL
jgi:hypothetical protein